MTRAMITAPNRYENIAWTSAIRRIGLEVRFVSDTWKVIPNGQGQVGKVQIGRGVILIEIDSAQWPGVEGARVTQCEHRMDHRPRQRHAQYSQCNQVGLGSTDCLASSDEDQSHSGEQSDPRGKNDEFGQPNARVFPDGMRIAACQLVNADTIAPTATPIDAVIATRIPAGVWRRRSDADRPGLTNES